MHDEIVQKWRAAQGAVWRRRRAGHGARRTLTIRETRTVIRTNARILALLCCCVGLTGAAAQDTSGTYTVIYNFGGTSADGRNPSAGVFPAYGNGALYGTTDSGGADGVGTVFWFGDNWEQVLYSFKRSGGDGTQPGSIPAAVRDMMYGTTNFGGSGSGTVFSLDQRTGAEKILYSFKGGNPSGTVISVDGILYGTTATGGTSKCSCGTIYSLNPATGAEAVVHNFQGFPTDGANPVASLIGGSGQIYGTTLGGGALENGTIFSFDIAKGTETVLYSFQNAPDGANPQASLLDYGGLLYGTTIDGGAYGQGTVFSFDVIRGTEKILYSFRGGSDGAHPSASLINALGTLYGTTESGGSTANGGGQGTLFSLDPTTGAEKVLHSFPSNPTDGTVPKAGLWYIFGRLYGTTYSGGSFGAGSGGYGTVFTYTP
jgi:uncharacterized repeat protein (TIGR03803 family)